MRLMILSTMRNKAKRFVYPLIAVAFWLAVWQIAYLIIDVDFIFPSVVDTFLSFVKISFTLDFWVCILYSFVRISVGFAIGVAAGILLAILCRISQIAKAVFYPAMSVIRSTPVASFILVLWFIIGSGSVPLAISFLMVMPIVWQSTLDAFSSIDKNLDEVCLVFSLSKVKRFKILVLPTLLRYFVPALLTSSGLAWKAGIAAEIIAYTKNSIGKHISDAKNFLLGPELFAWTVTVIILSVVIEKVITLSIRRFKENVSIR